MNKSIKFITKACFFLVLFLIIASITFFGVKHIISQTPATKIVSIKEHSIKVEIADTPVLRTKGLSGRKHLAKDAGMLFVFPKATMHSFWMKKMHFPLDFIWINGNTVVDLTENVLAPEDLESLDLTSYTPSESVDKVLEVNAGVVDSLNIQIGDKIKIKN